MGSRRFRQRLFVAAGISAGFCALFFGVAGGWERALAIYAIPLLGVVWAWFLEVKKPYALTVSTTGDVHFHRTWRSLSIPARDIVLVEGERRVGNEGETLWLMEARDRNGRIVRMQYFYVDDARAFVTTLLAQNPRIPVRGEWLSFWFPK